MRDEAVLGALVILMSAVAAASWPDSAAAAVGWQAEPALAEKLSAKRPEIIYDEAKVPKYELPDPLKARDGRPVTSPEHWKARRQELMELFRDQMYGRRPGRPDELRFEVLEEKPDALEGGVASLRRIAIHSRVKDQSHRFELILFLPKAAATKPAAVFVLINNRPPENIDATRQTKSAFWPVEQVIARGYGMATFACGQVAPDKAATFRDGVLKLFEGDATTRPADACGALAAWGWGASRVMDYLETDPRVDARRVAIVGHSRGGKASLWAGAEDERFALVVANGSGEGGASLSRRKFGETVGIINKAFPHWFCGNFKQYADREGDLPFDQHELLALIAPRAVYVASGSEDLWADPRGEFLALAGASGVYGLWEENAPIGADEMPAVEVPLVRGRRGYHIHTGPHDLGVYDWEGFADFADAVWAGRAGSPR